ncbi:MAG TPA: phytanoyl-CoA dioxygenase family protein [Allosphingosinicella sp.]|jgi:hypothetical protein
MQLHRDGAQLFPKALASEEVAALLSFFTNAPATRPGTRLNPPRDGECSGRPSAGRAETCRGQVSPEHDHAKHGGGGPALAPLLTKANTLAESLLGPAARPVRATFFDKNPLRNWALGWHQDRTLAVRARHDVPGFTDWTVKSGIHHAVPPVTLLERMLTLRLHLDDTPPDNAPLLVSPGTHLIGRLPEADIPAAVARHGTSTCPAAAGDIWAYSTLILHASDRARAPTRRRVLQLLYSADDLPPPLKWLGV